MVEHPEYALLAVLCVVLCAFTAFGTQESRMKWYWKILGALIAIGLFILALFLLKWST